MSTEVLAPRKSMVLVDLLPSLRMRTWARDAVLVVSFALLTAAFAQIKISLGFTPVPLTGQTLAVLLSGAALGMRRGAFSQIAYWGMGLVGLPFYAGGQSGWDAGTGTTLGYFVGFVVAAAVVGRLAERKADRQVMSSLSAMAFGTVIIYTFGALWLAHDLNIGVATGDPNAIALGVTPFLIGDLIKMIIAGVVTPVVWATVARGDR